MGRAAPPSSAGLWTTFPARRSASRSCSRSGSAPPSRPPGPLAGLLEAEERRHRERLADYEALDAQLVENGAGAHVRATLAFGLHYERAVLDWFAELPPEVRD